LTQTELAACEARLSSLEQSSGARLVVVTVADAQGSAPKTIAVNTLNRWQVGPRSVCLLICVKPRELYIQPGTELSPKLDDATCRAICVGVIAPHMKTDRARAIQDGLEAIAKRLAGDSPMATTGWSAPSEPSSSTAPPPRAPSNQRREPTNADGIVGLIFGGIMCGGPV